MAYTYTLAEKAFLPRTTFDELMPWKGMRRCLLKENGVVNYYLDPNDSTKKEDGSLALLDGTDGNVMVEIPKFWYKMEYTAGQYNWYISDGPQTGFKVHPAFLRDRDGLGIKEVDKIYIGAFKAFCDSAMKQHSVIDKYSATGSNTYNTLPQLITQPKSYIGKGWKILGWNELFAIQLLFLLEYQSFDCQSNLGKGITVSTTNINGKGNIYKPGNTVSNGNKSTSSKDANQDLGTYSVSYRGLEDLYSMFPEYVACANIALKGDTFTNGQFIVGHDYDMAPTDNSKPGINKFQISLPDPKANSQGRITDFEQNMDVGFLPSKFDGVGANDGIGQSLWYCPAYGNTNTNIMLFGFTDFGMNAGLWSLQIRDKTWSNTTYRLVY